MFEAWVLVCVVQMGNLCFPAQDSRGPYATQEQCYERTIEMGKDIYEGLPGHLPVDWKCIPVGSAT